MNQRECEFFCEGDGKKSPLPAGWWWTVRLKKGSWGRPSAFAPSPSPEKRISADKMGGLPCRQGRWAGANRAAYLYWGGKSGKGDIRGKNSIPFPSVFRSVLCFLLCALPGVTFYGRKLTSC